MANVPEPTRPTAPTSTSTPSPQDVRRMDEERNRTQGAQGTGVGTQFRDRAQEMGQQMRDKGQELGVQAQQLGAQVKETASQYYDQGRESLQEWNQTLEAQIHQKPLQSLLIAGGVGLLLGLLLRRS